MNIYILTRNHYLFTGVKHLLTNHVNYSCTMLVPEDSNIDSIVNNCTDRDAFIVILDDSYIYFSTLIKLHHCDARVIIVNNNYQWEAGGVFKFITMPYKFTLSDLLCHIHARKQIKNAVNIPMFSTNEKKVILLTQEGTTIREISSRLNIPIKTVYSSQRSALKKLGIRKSHNILKLPQDYIDQICRTVDISLNYELHQNDRRS